MGVNGMVTPWLTSNDGDCDALTGVEVQLIAV